MTDLSPNITLVTGGAASGKSACAERLARQSGLRRIYIATAQAHDAEMATKIADHQKARGSNWTTIEAPLNLAQAIRAADEDTVVLVDCLTMWIANLMGNERDVDAESGALQDALLGRIGPTICVTNEVGSGLVPMDATSRAFRNHQGRINQNIAALSSNVIAVLAGLPLVLKGGLPEERP